MLFVIFKLAITKSFFEFNSNFYIHVNDGVIASHCTIPDKKLPVAITNV